MMAQSGKIEIWDGLWSRSDAEANGRKVFVFGDNEARAGTGGQACVRGLPNTVGIRTKKAPGTHEDDYWYDDEYKNNTRMIQEDLKMVFARYRAGHTIVLSANRYGDGLAKLRETAPFTWMFLQLRMRDFVNYHNEQTGDTIEYPPLRTIRSQ